MAFGEILRNARIQKGCSPSDVAEGTHMLVQIVDALEREDLRRIAAPIYGRGFVKLYAEFLDLDVEPLIRDFMELYDGGRAPSIRLKNAEVRVDPAPVPVTRRVSETVMPEKQVLKPQAAVKAVVPESTSPQQVAVGEDEEVEKPKIREVAVKVNDDIVRTAITEDDNAFVVLPEEGDDESDSEPDLFNHTAPPRNRPEAVKGFVAGKKAGKSPRLAHGSQSSPVFKIGGHLDTAYMRDERKETARARRAALMKSVKETLVRLRDKVSRGWPENVPSKKVLAFGSAGLVAVLIMVSGLRVLFKMTGRNVAEAPAAVVERVAPPPDLYVD